MKVINASRALSLGRPKLGRLSRITRTRHPFSANSPAGPSTFCPSTSAPTRPIDLAKPPAPTGQLSPHRDSNSELRAAPVASITGDSYDGVQVNDVVVLFKRDLSARFTGVTFVEPANVAQHFVTGLTPGAQYAVAVTIREGETRVTIIKGVLAGALWFVADSEGVLSF